MSPQRDDVPALIHALAHNFRLFAWLFSVNNSCFLVHSSLCSGSMHHLSIAFSHLATLSEYAQTHTHTRAHTDTPLWLKHLPGMTKTRYYLLLFIIADAAIISWPRCLSPSSPCMCSFIQISITFSLFPGHGPSFNVYVYSDTSPSFNPRPHLFQSPPLHPRVQLLLQASFP